MPLSVPWTFAAAGLNTPTTRLDENNDAIVDWINARNPTVGLISARPAAGNAGALYVATDLSNQLSVDTGSTWVAIGVSTSAEIVLPIGEALPDFSGSNNNPPELFRWTSDGTQTSNTPKETSIKAAFDATTYEALMTTTVLPPNYASGGSLIVKFSMWTAYTGNIRIRGGVAVFTDESTNPWPITFNAADTLDDVPVPASAVIKEVTLPLTMTGAAAGKKVTFFIHLGPATTSSAADDRILESWRFRYTTT